MSENPTPVGSGSSEVHTTETDRQDRFDLALKVLIWVTIVAVAAIAFAIGLVIAQELLGAIGPLSLPIAVAAIVYAAIVHRKVNKLEDRMDREVL